MIFQALADLLLNLFESVFNFTIAPIESISSVTAYINLMLDSGINIFKFFIPPTGRVILVIILGAHAALKVYYIVMWVVKKIPMLNIH